MYNLANNIEGLTLSSAHAVGDGALVLSGAEGLPDAPFRVTVVTAATYQTDAEDLAIFGVTAVSGTTLTVVAIEGTADRAFAAGDKVDLRLTAGAIQDLNGAAAVSMITVEAEAATPGSRRLVAGTNITITDAGAGGSLTISAAGGGGGGSGTVTSVGLAAPDVFTVSGSPVEVSGTIDLALANQAANKVFAGPASGSDAAPAFRALTTADMPADYLTANQQITLSGDASGSGTTAVPITVTKTNGTAFAASATVDATNAGNISTGTLPVARLPVFGASGSGHSAGGVPDPGATAGATKYLREDATWDVPAGGGSIALTTTGTSGAASLASGTLNVPQYAGQPDIQYFTSNGTYTVPSWAKVIRVTVIGGGGGGGSGAVYDGTNKAWGGAGGGGGAMAVADFLASDVVALNGSSAVTVTVGGGGYNSDGVTTGAGGNGGPGGNTSFGALIQAGGATGGIGGTLGGSPSNGGGGAAGMWSGANGISSSQSGSIWGQLPQAGGGGGGGSFDGTTATAGYGSTLMRGNGGAWNNVGGTAPGGAGGTGPQFTSLPGAYLAIGGLGGGGGAAGNATTNGGAGGAGVTGGGGAGGGGAGTGMTSGAGGVGGDGACIVCAW